MDILDTILEALIKQVVSNYFVIFVAWVRKKIKR